MFWVLPQEVFDIIVGKLRHCDVDALSQSSKRLHAALAPTLWKGIRVDVAGQHEYEGMLAAEPMMRCVVAFQRPSAAVRHASRLTIRCDFRAAWYNYLPSEWRRDACPHARSEWAKCRVDEENGEGDSRLRAARLACFDRIVEGAVAVVKSLPKDQLRSFRWDMAACVPPAVVDALATRHPRLESLQFMTDTFCLGPPAGLESPVVNMLPLKELRRISWRAPPPHHLEVLASAIRRNRSHLEELDLDMESWRYLTREATNAKYSAGECPNILVDIILSTRLYQSPGPVFPSLRALTLRGARLDIASDEQELHRAIDLSALESLTLRCCSGWGRFLTALETSGKPIHLKALEVQCRGFGNGDAKISRFVASFEGLVDLFVSFSGPDGRDGFADGRQVQFHLWRSLGHHRATLKRFVYHKKPYPYPAEYSTTRAHDLDLARDCTDLGIAGLGLEAQMSNPTLNPMSGPSLECLGLSCDPRYLIPLLQPFTAKSTLKILHVRQTGSEGQFKACTSDRAPLALSFLQMRHGKFESENGYVRSVKHDYLQELLRESFRSLVGWAYGPDGIPSLQVIAFGDFSHGRNGRSLHNLFVCRSEDPGQSSGRVYRVFDPRDREHAHEWTTLVRPYRWFLESCPLGSFLPQKYYTF